MTFIVTLIALLLERFFDWSHLRRFNWYLTLENKISTRFQDKSPYLILALTIVPLLIIVGLIQFLIYGVLYGFIELLFELFVVIYCLGPQNLWADAFAALNAFQNGNAAVAKEKLQKTFGLANTKKDNIVHQNMIDIIFIEANRRLFSVIFWYVALGPIGALLYRTITLSASGLTFHLPTTSLAKSARLIETILDWVPVRLFTFLFALGGHFAQVLAAWSKYFIAGLDDNEVLLTQCGIAALGVDKAHPVPKDGSGLRSAISLLDRVFIITLVIIALLVIIF